MLYALAFVLLAAEGPSSPAFCFYDIPQVSKTFSRPKHCESAAVWDNASKVYARSATWWVPPLPAKPFCSVSYPGVVKTYFKLRPDQAGCKHL